MMADRVTGRSFKLFLTFAAAVLLSPPLVAHDHETASVVLGGQQFQVELAVTREEKQQGLMHREQLPAGTGMLFIYAQPQPTRFWNKNVLFPIDILYFDRNRAFLRADTHVLPCPYSDCPVYRSGQPVKYVLELPAGTRAQLTLLSGERFRFR